ncbi:MAG: hypothetical protein ACRDHX_06870 [Chloroflexota bacterium]
MAFTLADTETGNFVGAYRSEEEALRDVFDIVERFGAESREVLTLSLAGEVGFVANGRDLAHRALKRFGQAARRSA